MHSLKINDIVHNVDMILVGLVNPRGNIPSGREIDLWVGKTEISKYL